MRIKNFILPLLIVLGFTLLGLFFGVHRMKPQARQITVVAKKYAYDPPIIRINKGDTVTLKMEAKDVTHGFFLEGYGINLKDRPETPHFWVEVKPEEGVELEEGAKNWKQVEEITFTANRTGKFRYRCSITCGILHPFMQGELIVEPNYPYYVALGMALGIAIAAILRLARKKENE